MTSPDSSLALLKRAARSLVLLGMLALPAGVVFAQVGDPVLQKELAALRAADEKAAAAALAPLNRNYIAALEKLGTRAAQQKDEATVEDVKAAIATARMRTQTEASVATVLAGSRWKWFSNGTLVGTTEAFIDFYRDGVARTSWGNRVSYRILPPASLRISQGNPKQEWYFLVDVSKKQAVADPFFSEGREKRSLKWERSGPPVEPKTPPTPAY